LEDWLQILLVGLDGMTGNPKAPLLKKIIGRLIFWQNQSSIENRFFSIDSAFIENLKIEFPIDF
jgi:hypothetical protein